MSANVRHGFFDAQGERLGFSEFTPASKPAHTKFLSLHGAGKAVRQRVFYLTDDLIEAGLGFFCFDFSGHGESSGAMAASTLEKRRNEALAAYHFMGPPAPTILSGNSMGGYIAAELIKDAPIDHLILFCPALYAASAYDVPFDERFTEILRTPDSFENNRVLDHASKFSGSVLLIIGENDSVIPDRVMKLYDAAFVNAKKKEFAVVPDAGHQIHVWAAEDKARTKSMTRRLLDFIAA
ncbi:MAG: alpha/beta fold hydrolase [Alphaproteobacteria bacterium]